MALLHAKYNLVKIKSTRQDPFVDQILEGKYADELRAAKKIWESPIKKSYLESCMLATQDLNEIQELLEIPAATLHVYRELFFNVVGYSKLDKLEALEDASTEDERAMKLWAISQGLDFLKWRLGKVININPVVGLQELFSTAIYKSKEALFSSNSAESSKEAVKWTRMSMDLGRLIKAYTTDTHAAKNEIEMALQSVIPDFQGFDDLDR